MKQNITSNYLMVLLKYYHKRRDLKTLKINLKDIMINISTIIEFDLKYKNLKQ